MARIASLRSQIEMHDGCTTTKQNDTDAKSVGISSSLSKSDKIALFLYPSNNLIHQ
jgi:hypothetical protein